MDKKLLEYFLVLCQTGNITATADKVHLSRQALSHNIRSLEQELGLDLFVRCKSGVILTEAGRLLKEYAEQMAVSWEELQRRMRTIKDYHQIRFGTHLMHRNASYFHSVISYQEIEPLVHISFHNEEDYSVLWQLLKKNELDVVETRKIPIPDTPELKWVKKGDCKICVLVSKNNSLAKLDKVDFDNDIKGQTYLSVSQDTLKEMRPFLKEAEAGEEFVTPNQTLLRELIEMGEGIFAIPQYSSSCLISDKIVVKEFVNFPIPVADYIIFRPNPPEYLCKFINHLNECRM